MCVLLLARAAAGCADAKMLVGCIAFFAFPRMSYLLNKLLRVAMSDQFDYDRTTCARAPRRTLLLPLSSRDARDDRGDSRDLSRAGLRAPLLFLNARRTKCI